MLFSYQICYEKTEFPLGIVQLHYPISKGETVTLDEEMLQNLKSKKKLIYDSNKFTVHSVHHFLTSYGREPELPILLIKQCIEI